jgi:Cu-Zn family superoxide dismutase
MMAAAALATGCGGKSPPAVEALPVGQSARAELRDAQGQRVGTATLVQGPNGVLVTADLTSLPAGTHALHFHETGRCESPFTSAGGHFNPGQRQHGVHNAEGMHAGDLPNVNVSSGGTIRVEMFTAAVTLGRSGAGLLDDDGSALVIHERADDYRTDPAGASGNRIACGVVTRQ